MRLFLLTALTMLAFAANSLLTRAGVASGTDPVSFAVIRVLAGAGVLAVLALATRGSLPLRRKGGRAWQYLLLSVLGLVVYLGGFSMAYLTLDAGVGALILFATVQAGLFGAAVATGQSIGWMRWLGMGIALTALAWLLWPGPDARIDLFGAGLMVCAGLGWALYTWQGRGSAWALGDTAANFLWASLALLLVWLPLGGAVSAQGLLWGVVSGALASGLGYALWFHVLPQIQTTTAALVQLTVPVIAILGGALLLGEALSLQVGLACLGVIGGIALGLRPAQPKRGSNGS